MWYLDDWGNEHDCRISLILPDFAEQNVLKALLRSGKPKKMGNKK